MQHAEQRSLSSASPKANKGGVPPIPYAQPWQRKYAQSVGGFVLLWRDELYAGEEEAREALEMITEIELQQADKGIQDPIWVEAQIDAEVAWARFGGHLLREHTTLPAEEFFRAFMQLIAERDWRVPAQRRWLLQEGWTKFGSYHARKARDGGFEALRKAARELEGAWDKAHERELLETVAQQPAVPADEGAAVRAAGQPPLWTQKDKQPFTNWSQLTVEFMNRETVEVGGRQYTYDKCGFRDGLNREKNDPPVTRAWCALAMLAHLDSKDQEPKLPCKKEDIAIARQVSALRTRLRSLTGLPKDSDPLPHQKDESTGQQYWRPVFCVRSAAEFDALAELAARFRSS